MLSPNDMNDGQIVFGIIGGAVVRGVIRLRPGCWPSVTWDDGFHRLVPYQKVFSTNEEASEALAAIRGANEATA
jgi:hypothetical protein